MSPVIRPFPSSATARPGEPGLLVGFTGVAQHPLAPGLQRLAAAVAGALATHEDPAR